MNDLLLSEFVLNTKMHENSINHAREKGMKLNNLNVWFQPETWEIIGGLIESGEYKTKPTKVCYLDKVTGNPLTYKEAVKRNFEKVREIYVMELMDRVVWNMFYQICYKYFSDWIHPNCKSYKKGESTRTVAKELSSRLGGMKFYKGKKHDLTKYFDSVPIEVIDKMLDKMEKRYPSCIWKVIREFYHDNRVIINGEHVERYGSLKQGCAFACLLADIILYEVDEEMSKYDVIYYRYSDDLIIIGKDWYKADKKLREMLEEMGLKINDKKTECITNKDWFTFLGFRFRGDKVTISEKSLRNLKIKIKMETISKSRQLHRALTKKELLSAIDNIQSWFFTDCEKCQGGMASYLFGACNVMHDIYEIDEWIKQCIRGAYTNRCEIYGLGISHGKYGIVPHCKGKNVGMNMMRAYDIPRELGWYSLVHMYKMYHDGTGIYNSEVQKMKNGVIVEL